MLETAFLVFLIVFLVVKYVMNRRSDEDMASPLPPGSMGWPIIGETFKLAAQKVRRTQLVFRHYSKHMQY